MEKLMELREKYAKLVADLREIHERPEKDGREWNGEDDQAYTRCFDESEKVEKQIERLDKLERTESQMQESATEPIRPNEERSLETPEEGADEEVLDRQMATWFTDGNVGIGEELRALQVDIDTSGGYITPTQQFVNRLIKAVDNNVLMRRLATVVSVPKAESLGAPSLDNDPADPEWISELSIGSEDSTMDFGKRELFPHENGQFIKVSRKMLRKATIGPEALVRNRLAYKMSVVQENVFLNGTGAGQPLGVFTASSDGISTGRDVSTGNTSTTIAADNLIECKYNQKEGYWGKLRWIFHRDALKMIHKLKDGEGRYLLVPNLQAGPAQKLLDFPMHSSEYAPNTFTASLYVGILGDFSNYWIADALSMSIQRLDELYAATSQVGFISRSETDGMPVLEEAFTRVKLAA